MAIRVTSPAFAHGQPIPKKYTNDGEDISPPIQWADLPKGTQELVLICEDPDAPTAEPWVHWVAHKIPAALGGLPEGLPKEPRSWELHGILQGKNSWKIGQNIELSGAGTPPAVGSTGTSSDLRPRQQACPEPGLDRKSLWKHISGHIIGEGELMGTYHR